MLAILLLEAHKNPLPEVLNLFLSQRFKALEDIHASAVQTGPRPSAVNFSFGKSLDRSGRSPISVRNSIAEQSERKNRHSRKDSRLNAAEVLRGLSPASRNNGRAGSGSASDLAESSASRKAKNQEKRKINEQNRASKVFQDSIKLLWETVASARAVILSEDTESLVVRMMKTIQTPNSPQTGSDAKMTLVSTSMLLRNMPSSQILTSYLPASVQNFAPYIGDLARGVQEGSLRNTLEEWLKKSLSHLEKNSVAWLEGIDTVTDVWVVKRRMSDMLDGMAAAQDAAFKEEEFATLRKEISKAFTDRAKAIWQLRLDTLAVAAENGVSGDLEALMQGDDDIAQGESGIVIIPQPCQADHLRKFQIYILPWRSSARSSFPRIDLVLRLRQMSCKTLPHLYGNVCTTGLHFSMIAWESSNGWRSRSRMICNVSNRNLKIQT